MYLYSCLARQRSCLSGEDDGLCRSLPHLFMPVYCFTLHPPTIDIADTGRSQAAADSLPSSSRESMDIIYGLLVHCQRTVSYPPDTTSQAWRSNTVTIGHVFFKSSSSCPFLLHFLHSKGHSTPRTKPFLIEPPHPWDRLHFPLYLCRLS